MENEELDPNTAWAAKVFAFLFNQSNFLPDGAGKTYILKLLLEAPEEVKDLGAQGAIGLEKDGDR